MRRTGVQNALFLKFLNCFLVIHCINFMFTVADQGNNGMAIRNFSQIVCMIRFADFAHVRGVCGFAVLEGSLLNMEYACIQGS